MKLGAVLASRLLAGGGARAQPPSAEPLRIGLVVPTQTPGIPVTASLYEPVGEAARMGATLAWEGVDANGAARDLHVQLVLASSPHAEAAFRAAQRLVSLDGVHALIGGLGEGQAEMLSAVAREHEIPFINIGSAAQQLRVVPEHPYTFHVEASSAMYLTALLQWYTNLGHTRWFVLGERSARGSALQTQALEHIRSYPSAVEVVGTASTQREQPTYLAELAAARAAEADLILLLLGPKDQIAFLAQQEAAEGTTAVALCPDLVAQTRDYIAAARYRADESGSVYRAMIWEATLEAEGAKGLNDTFMARWGRPMDGAAWTAYQAVKILSAAALATQSTRSPDLRAYLESPRATFAVGKGDEVHFRASDHQLLQPLYMIEVSLDAPWGLTLHQQLGIAKVAGEIKRPYNSGETSVERRSGRG